MKKKKLCAVAVASTLAAAQMAMPVMAAGGTITSTVTTKTGLIRVVVPTTLPVAIDEFQMMTSGTQIHSEEFTMENKSELDVMIKITSTATLDTGVTLKDTKAAAEESTGSDLWLAAAAQTGAGDYDDPKTTTSTEDIADLTEANANVATLSGDDKKAEQTFYLKKAADAYKLLNAGEVATDIVYAEFYELTALTITGADGAAKQADLNSKIAAGDVYVAAAAAANGQALTKVAKGGTHTQSDSEVYYSVADTATAAADVASTKLYVYADGTVDSSDGKAGFRYIGTLGDKAGWTSGATGDVKTVTISYEITGVKQDTYTDLKGTGSDTSLYYGLYINSAAAPSIATTTVNHSGATGSQVTVDLGAGAKAATGIAKVEWALTAAGSYTECASTDWAYDTDTKKLTFNKSLFGGATAGQTRVVRVTFNDTDKTPVVLTLTKTN